MHATCFRPVEMVSLERNPFRVFTTLLRPELIKSDHVHALAADLLVKRRIFSDRLLELLQIGEDQGGRLTAAQSENFISEALHTFGWKPVAGVTLEQYNNLRAEHLVLADVVSFQSAHINHLTPRTLDIEAAQLAMQNVGMEVKSRIEGPPPRKWPILLRQTSFLAVEEPVKFLVDGEHVLTEGNHRARFGEIEERGAAVTKRGRELYDALLAKASRAITGHESPEEMDQVLADVFQQYPDDWDELRKQGLVYCAFECNEKPVLAAPKLPSEAGTLLEQLLSDGTVTASPITYEDFLPFSAAGIFQSNLPKDEDAPAPSQAPGVADRNELEAAMGEAILDTDDWYASIQRQTLEAVAAKLGLNYSDLV
ncbi:hypothetical protein BDW75DRAFT_235248 [Aspergillus navahoensis]